MVYSHPIQLVLMLATLVAAILGILWLASMGENLLPAGWAFPAACLLGVAGAVLMLAHVAMPASTWLYLALVRRTVVTFAEARELTPLFSLNRQMSWFPMPEITAMPPAERVPYMRRVLVEAREAGIIRRPRRRAMTAALQ